MKKEDEEDRLAETPAEINESSEDRGEMDEIDLEFALVAALASRDVSGPEGATETVDLAKLTPNEKRALLHLMRSRLHLPPPTTTTEPDASQ